MMLQAWNLFIALYHLEVKRLMLRLVVMHKRLNIAFNIDHLINILYACEIHLRSHSVRDPHMHRDAAGSVGELSTYGPRQTAPRWSVAYTSY